MLCDPVCGESRKCRPAFVTESKPAVPGMEAGRWPGHKGACSCGCSEPECGVWLGGQRRWSLSTCVNLCSWRRGVLH